MSLPHVRRHAGLDLLRALAIALVLVYHLPGRLETWPAYLRPLGQIGWIGVDLFFALSGFLVGGLLLRDYPAVQARRFLIRRALKIYPAFYVMLLGLAVIMRLDGWSAEPAAWWHEILFVQNYLGGVNAPSWSLAIEEHFYLLLAGLVALLAWRRAPVRTIGLLAVAVGVIELMLRLGARPPFPHGPTHLRLDSLFWGVGLAALHHELGAAALCAFGRRYRLPLVLGAAALLATPRLASTLLADHGVVQYALGYTALSLASLVLILLVLPLNSLRGAAWWLARIGRDSYGIYLWHGPLYLLGGGLPEVHQGQFQWGLAAALLVGAVALGVVMSAAIEWPVLAWRDRRFPSRGRLATA